MIKIHFEISKNEIVQEEDIMHSMNNNNVNKEILIKDENNIYIRNLLH